MYCIKIQFFKEQLDVLRKLAPNVDVAKLSQLLSCAHALVTQEAVSVGLPDFPLDSLSSAALILVNSQLSDRYHGDSFVGSPTLILHVCVGQKSRLVGVRHLL